MTDPAPLSALSVDLLKLRLTDVAETEIARHTTSDRGVYEAALAVIQRLIAQGTKPEETVSLPWRCPPTLRRQIVEALGADAQGGSPAVRRAGQRLWTLWRETGLVTGTLGSVETPVRPAVADVTQPGWELAPCVERLRAYLGSADALCCVVSDAEAQETTLVTHAAASLAVSGITPSYLLPSLALLPQPDIDWRGESIVLRRSRRRRGSRRYRIAGLPLLHLGRLELFYQTTGAHLRAAGGSGWLSPRWHRVERLSDALRALVQRVCPEAQERPWRVSHFLEACRCAAARSQPPLIVSYRADRLIVAQADADLRALGIPIVGEDAPELSVGALRLPASGADVVATPLSVEARHLLSQLRAHTSTTPKQEREVLATQLDVLLKRYSVSDAPSNAHLVCWFAVDLLRRADASATVRNTLNGLWLLDEATAGIPFVTLSAAERHDRCVDLVQGCVSPGAMSAMRNRLRAWCRFLRNHAYIAEEPRWRDPELMAPQETNPQPVLLFRQIEQLLARARAKSDALEAATLAARFGGLRRTELCSLVTGDVLRGPLGLTRIVVSKSAAGIRVLPLALLMPPPALCRAAAYHERRLQAAGPAAPWLVNADGTAWTPDALGRAFERLAERALGRPYGLHTLRRSFAALLLIQVMAAFGLCKPARERGSTLCRDAMSPEALARIRRVFGELTIARNPEVTASWVIASLLGHAAPTISYGYYLGSVEWIQYLLDLGDGMDAALLVHEVATVLGLTGPRQIQNLVKHRPGGRVALTVVKDLLVRRITSGQARRGKRHGR